MHLNFIWATTKELCVWLYTSECVILLPLVIDHLSNTCVRKCTSLYNSYVSWSEIRYSWWCMYMWWSTSPAVLCMYIWETAWCVWLYTCDGECRSFTLVIDHLSSTCVRNSTFLYNSHTTPRSWWCTCGNRWISNLCVYTVYELQQNNCVFNCTQANVSYY